MKRTLIKCGWLVSMDEAVGDLRDADLLIEDDRIVAIGKSLDAACDEVIDASRMIVMPGIVNAHHHTFQAVMRSLGSEWLKGEYFKLMYADMSTRFTPEDNYLGNLVGALGQIDSGVTTLADYCHNLTSLEMAERSLDGLEESGVRAIFVHGDGVAPKHSRESNPPEQRLHPRQRVDALRKGRLTSDDARVTLGLGILGPDFGTIEASIANYRMALEYGVWISSHYTRPKSSRVTPDGYWRLAEEGLLAEGQNAVHCNFLEDDEFKLLADHGLTFTATALVELHGYAAPTIIGRCRAAGITPSIGVDTEILASGGIFREMHACLLFERNNEHRSRRQKDKPPHERMPVSSREALRWATIGGAMAMGLEDRIGSLTPGKKADIVMLRADDLNLSPVHDPIFSIVEQAHPGNVDAVIIDGIFRKRGGKLLFAQDILDRRRTEIGEAARRIQREAGFELTPAA